MPTSQGHTLTPAQQLLIARGLARVDRGYVVPVIRGGSDDGGDPPPGDPPADPPAGDQPAADRTFTQQDVDRIVRERLARAKTEPPPDYQELQAKAQKLAEIEAANMSELEKAQQRAAELEQREQRAREQLTQAAVLAEATKQSAIRPEHLHRLIDMSAVTVGDDGQVAGVQEAVKAFLSANPEYVGTRPVGSADQGARGTTGVKQVTEPELKTMKPEEIVKAKAEGRLNDLLGVR